jgi:myosin heavy subunit
MDAPKSYPFWVRDKKHAWLACKSKQPSEKSGRVKLEVVSRGGASSHVVHVKEVGPLKWDPQDKSRDGKPNWLRAHGSHFGNNVLDIAKLANMNEAAMIDVLRRRFKEGKIYTQVSDILIVVNPYVFIDGLYDIGPPSQYKLHDCDPHIYVTAESVFTCMASGETGFPRNQSVIVSGESGAGKTEACKSVMRYLAARSHSVMTTARRASKIARRASMMQRAQASTVDIEQRVLACNPFLEAFGNAKTLMNDNSSRFGKFLRILYRNEHIVGASMETYLLEKGRIVNQGPMERSYHIFYQICDGLTSTEKNKLGLQNAGAYKMLTRGGKRAVTVDSIDDARDFNEARQAMTTVGINAAQQWELFQILAGLLELNNVEWVATGRGSSSATVQGVPMSAKKKSKVTNSDVLTKAAKLLGLHSGPGPRGIEYQLSMRMNDSASKRGSIIYRALDPSQCRDAIAALTKHTYSIVFDWLVKQVNDRLKPEIGDEPESYIGILDIFGFEIFKHNSFEQLCINFANEKLQRLFQTHVFENEQKMYEAEGIPLHHLQFKSNVHCISLIEGRDAGSGYQGILYILDEFSKTERDIDTDATYAALLLSKFGPKSSGTEQSGKAAKMYKSASKYIEFPKFPPVEWFRVKHFAGPVKYEFANFLEKNRDKTFVHLKQMMASSKHAFVSKLFKTLGGINSGSRKKKRQVATIAGKFVKQLQGLTKTILATRNHYVRCVKPNDSKLSYSQGHPAFEAPKVLRQLLYAGVMATIEIRQAGFPYRETLESFWTRSIKNNWHILAKVDESVGPRRGIKAILDVVQQELGIDTPIAAIGTTRVFGKDHLINSIREWHQTKVVDRLLLFARGKLERLLFLRRWEEKMKRKYAKNFYAKVLGRAAAACAYVQKLREEFQAALEAARIEEAQRLAAIEAEKLRLEAEVRAERERQEALARAEAEAAEAEAVRLEQIRLQEEAEAERKRRQLILDNAVGDALDAAFVASAEANELVRVCDTRIAEALKRQAAKLEAIKIAKMLASVTEDAVTVSRIAATAVFAQASEAVDMVERIVARAAAAEAEMRRIQEKTDAAMREAELLGRSPFSVLDKTVFNMQNSVYRYTLGSNLNRSEEHAPIAAVPTPQWLISTPSATYSAKRAGNETSSKAIAISNLEEFSLNQSRSSNLLPSMPIPRSPYGALSTQTTLEKVSRAIPSSPSSKTQFRNSNDHTVQYVPPSHDASYDSPYTSRSDASSPILNQQNQDNRESTVEDRTSRANSWMPYRFSPPAAAKLSTLSSSSLGLKSSPSYEIEAIMAMSESLIAISNIAGANRL